ncbi:MAG TPA: hypothetical protein ENO31_03425 [Thermoprotei archaeon]|nr:hypothetical protein [TACK group archaeon]HEV51567.1 hypothetical protein [Thermoprotei archaeon]
MKSTLGLTRRLPLACLFLVGIALESASFVQGLSFARVPAEGAPAAFPNSLYFFGAVLAVVLEAVVGIVLMCFGMYGFLSGPAESKEVFMLACSSCITLIEAVSLALMGCAAFLWSAYVAIGAVFAYGALSRRRLSRAFS